MARGALIFNWTGPVSASIDIEIGAMRQREPA
jgi:hypothetical protein